MTMTVAELIADLQRLPADTPVFVQDGYYEELPLDTVAYDGERVLLDCRGNNAVRPLPRRPAPRP